jgi:hypothetical protein
MIAERVVFITSGSFAAEISKLTPTCGGSLKFMAASYSVSMAANVVATALMAYRTWSVLSHYCRFTSNFKTGYSIKPCRQFSLKGEAK